MTNYVCMSAWTIWHIASSCLNLLPFVVTLTHLGQQELCYHEQIIDKDDVDNIFLKEMWINDIASPKSISNSEFYEMHKTFLYLMGIGIVGNSIILFIHVTIHL